MRGGKGAPGPLRILVRTTAYVFGSLFALSAVSTITIQSLQAFSEAKRKKLAPPCKECKGTGFYECKLCKGNSTIEWSPLYDPVFVNPCVCPTCDGNRVQRCLNCIGKGYA